MIFGAAGLLVHNIPLMLIALFAMGVHSTFFGPIKYAILPQHLNKDEVLGGTGLVEAGTYVAILMGTIAGGLVKPAGSYPAAAAGVLLVALDRLAGRPGAARAARARRSALARWTGTSSAPRSAWSTRRCTSRGCSSPSLAISFFWMMGAILAAQFPPLVKNVLQRQRAGRDPLPRHLLGRGRDRLGADQPAAEGPGRGRLFARLGDRHGPVRLPPLLRASWPAAGGELIDVEDLHRHPAGRLGDVARPVRGRRLGRHVRRPALRLPHHHRPQVGDGADRGGQQYRQFGRDGACGPGPVGLVQIGVSVEETLLLAAHPE
jgi:hypothetical protein